MRRWLAALRPLAWTIAVPSGLLGLSWSFHLSFMADGRMMVTSPVPLRAWVALALCAGCLWIALRRPVSVK